jgi:hypothetical protein
VLGEIAPLDLAAPPIRFEVNLPEQWNGKAVQYGGGGFNGVLITGLDPLRDARLDTPVPVARGFATWGTDSGHDNAKLAEIQAFALNAEALENFAFASYKKVREFAPSKANAHQRLPCHGTLWRQISPRLWGLPDRVLHCGISAPSADGFMAEMGHKPAYLSPRRAGGMSASPR